MVESTKSVGVGVTVVGGGRGVRGRGAQAWRRGLGVVLGAVMGLAGVGGGDEVRGADFWWQGDLSGRWSEEDYDIFLLTTINTNWATTASGATDWLRLPGAGDVVRFSTANALNVGSIILDLGPYSVLGIRTEGPQALDVNMSFSILEVGASGIVVEGTGIMRFDRTVLSRPAGFNYDFNVNNAAGQVWVTGNGDWLSGGRAVVKNGPGNLRLAGGNTFSGAVVVNDGALTLASSGAIPAGRSVNVNRGFLRVTGVNSTVGNLVFGDGGTTVGAMGTSADLGGFFTLNGGIQFNGGNGTPAAVLAAPMVLPAGNHTVSNPNFTPAIGSYDVILSGGISGAGGLVKQSSGFFAVLNAGNTYLGGTTVSAGTLYAAAGGALPSGGALAVNGGTLSLSVPVTQNGVVAGNYSQTVGTISGNGAIVLGSASLTASDGTFSGPISGVDGRVVKQGAGVLTLSGNNTFSGGVVVNGGTLRLGSAGAFPAGADLVVAEGVVDLLGRSPSVRNLVFGDGARTGQKAVVNTNLAVSPAVTVSGNVIYLGVSGVASPGIVGVPIVLTAGVHGFESPNGQYSNTEYGLVFSGGISGAGSVVKGYPELYMAYTAPTTYAGPTTINQGIIYLATANALTSGHAVVVNGGTLSMSPPLTQSGVTAGSYSQVIGSLAGGTGGGRVDLGSATLRVGDGSSTTFVGTILGTGGKVVKQGSGVLTLGGVGTWTGGTEVVGGTLQVTAGGALPNGRDVWVKQGTLDAAGVSPVVGNLLLGDGVSGGAVVVTNSAGGVGAGAAITVNGNISFYGSVTTDRAVVSAPLFFPAGQHVVDNPTASFSGVAYDVVFTKPISGPGGLTKTSGFTTIALLGQSTYAGPTVLEAGAIVAGAVNVFPAGTAMTLNGGVLRLDPFLTAGGVVAGSYSQTIGSLSGVGQIELGGATLTVGDGTNTVYSGNVFGSNGRWVKQGAGTLTLGGLHAYSGGTEIRGGTLRLGTSVGIPGGGNVTVAVGVLDLGGNSVTVGNLNFGNGVSLGAKSVVSTVGGLPAGGSLTVNGEITYSGAGFFSDSTGRVDVPVVLSAGQHVMRRGNGVPSFSYDIVFGRSVSGAGGMTVDGSVTLGMVEASTYAGATTVNSGAVYLGGANVLPEGTALTVNGGVVVMNPSFADQGIVAGNYDQKVGSLAGSGGGVSIGEAQLTVGDGTSTVFSGSISGGFGGRLVKVGAGTLELNGSSFYGGGTRVEGGRLKVGSAGALPSGWDVAVSEGVLEVAGGVGGVAVTVGDLTLGDGVKDGARSVVGTGLNPKVILNGSLIYNGKNGVSSPAVVNVGIELPAGLHSVLNPNNQFSSSQYDVVLNGVISGAGGLVKNGANLFVAMTAPGTYAGETVINQGVIYVGTTNALPTGTAVTLGLQGVLSLRPPATENGVVIGSYNQRIGSLLGGGLVDLGSATLTVGDATTSEFAGILRGEGGRLTKVGNGTLVLTGASTYSGGTAVNNGVLAIGNGGTTGSIVGDVDVRSLLVFDRSDFVAFPGQIKGAGSLSKRGLGTLQLTGDLVYVGNTEVVGGGALLLNNPLQTPGSRLDVGENSAVYFNSKRIPEPTVTGEFGLLVVNPFSLAQVLKTNRAAGLLPGMLVLDKLEVSPDGFLDLTNNDMVVRDGNLERIRDLVRLSTVANDGLPGSRGIGSSNAFYTVDGAFTTVSVYDNSLEGQTFEVFNGVPVPRQAVILKYTYWGDTNLDGVVDATDLTRVLQGLNGEGTGWNFGDVDHDGSVTMLDLGRTMAALRGQGEPLGGAGMGGGGTIPEPAGVAVLGVVGVVGLRRRRRGGKDEG